MNIKRLEKKILKMLDLGQNQYVNVERYQAHYIGGDMVVYDMDIAAGFEAKDSKIIQHRIKVEITSLKYVHIIAAIALQDAFNEMPTVTVID